MVEPNQVDAVRRRLHPGEPPGEFLRRMGLPTVERVAPELAVRAEIVGRNARDEQRSTRLVKLEQMRSDPKIKDRPKQTHDMLDDFVLLYDELNDNVDTYVDRKDDIRKPLRIVVEADNEFQAKLRALKQAATASPEEIKEYDFLLADTLDAVDTSAPDHRQLLSEQEEAFKHKKPAKQ